MSRGANYAFKVLLFFDIFACALIFRDPDITLSAEVGLAMRRPQPPRWARIINRLLDVIQTDHCAMAIEHDIARAVAAISYLKGSP